MSAAWTAVAIPPVLALLGWILKRLVDRLEKRLDAIETVASDALSEVTELRGYLEGMVGARPGGRRTYDPGGR